MREYRGFMFGGPRDGFFFVWHETPYEAIDLTSACAVAGGRPHSYHFEEIIKDDTQSNGIWWYETVPHEERHLSLMLRYAQVFHQFEELKVKLVEMVVAGNIKS